MSQKLNPKGIIENTKDPIIDLWIFPCEFNKVHFFIFYLKLTYQSFEVEESEDCSYDAVTVYEDVGKEEEIGLTFDFWRIWGMTYFFYDFH